MSNERKIILFPNAENDIDFIMTQKVENYLEKGGWKTVLCPAFIDTKPVSAPPTGFVFADFECELNTAEMIITLGGDGTILRAARSAADAGIPILGINMGGKGFIAELEVEDIELLKYVTTGGYEIESRMMIDVEVQRGGEVICRDFALNDIVIKGGNKVIDMTIYGDGHKITYFTGDGTIIATPTGSTAYSMSAGGPIVEPSAKNIVITPICAHLMEAKTFVLTAGRVVTVEVDHKKNNPAYVSVDGGKHISIFSGDIVKVCKSERLTKLVRLSDRSFYHKISSKLISRAAGDQ